ncbi:MAG: cupredoxin domain-containing protein [Mycobacteriales bacterium]
MNRTLAALAVPLLMTACSSGGSSSKDSAGSGAVSAEGPPTAQTVTVAMRDTLKFQPDTVAAKVGTLTITVTNSGQVPHNLIFDQAGLGKTDTVDGKTTTHLKVVFDKAGTYSFVCTFHSGMTGKVIVS